MLRNIVGWIFIAIPTALGLLKKTAEWVGLTTSPEDAVALRQKVQPMIDFIVAQPDIKFYGALAVLALIGMIALIPAASWRILGGRLLGRRTAPAPHGGTNTTYGAGSHVFAGPVHSPVFNPPARKFSGIFEVTTLPKPLGGVNLVDLAGVATLRLHVPYSAQKITMALDIVPTRHPDQLGPDFQSTDIYSYSLPVRTFEFDTQSKKRHTFEVEGKIFTITLREIELLAVESVANPLKFVFSVVEA